MSENTTENATDNTTDNTTRWIGPALTGILTQRLLPVMAAAVVLVSAACSATGNGPEEEVADLDRTVTSASSSTLEGEASATDSDSTGTESDSADSGDQTSDPGQESQGAADDGQDPDAPTTAALGLVWTAVGVEFDDVLNVRTGPNPDEPIVAELSPWTTSLPIGGDDAGPEYRDEGAGTWLLVADGATGEGWVNQRFVVAQPVNLSEDDRDKMVEASQQLLSVLTDTEATTEDLGPILDEQGVWVGGTGVYADLPSPWQWFAVDDVDDAGEWLVDQDFEFPPDFDFDCPECRLPLVDFVGLNKQDQPVEIIVNDIAEAVGGGFFDGALFRAPQSLHRVVLEQPNTEYVADDGSIQPNLDWRRIHLIFDWSDGEPRIALINTHGWTP